MNEYINEYITNRRHKKKNYWELIMTLGMEPYLRLQSPMALSYTRVTLLQKQQIKSCFLSPRQVYNELNIGKIDIASTLILTRSKIK